MKFYCSAATIVATHKIEKMNLSLKSQLDDGAFYITTYYYNIFGKTIEISLLQGR